jgi:hypothetical protein
MRGFKPPWCLLCEESLLRHSTAPGSWQHLPSHAASLGATSMHSLLLTKSRKIEWSSPYIPWYEPFNSFWYFWVKIRDPRDGGWEEREGGNIAIHTISLNLLEAFFPASSDSTLQCFCGQCAFTGHDTGRILS